MQACRWRDIRLGIELGTVLSDAFISVSRFSRAHCELQLGVVGEKSEHVATKLSQNQTPRSAEYHEYLRPKTAKQFK